LESHLQGLPGRRIHAGLDPERVAYATQTVLIFTNSRIPNGESSRP
jgi:hypothetical protein